MDEKEKEVNKKLKEDIHALKEKISTEGIQTGNNMEYLYKLVDIEKDLCEIEKGGESMKDYGRYGYNDYGAYNEYNEYNRGGYGREGYGRDEYGRSNYGRRGRYRGDEQLNAMYNEYGRYEEGKEQYNRGNYNAKQDATKSLEYMLESMVDFVKMLKSDAKSQEELNLIKEYTKKLSEM